MSVRIAAIIVGAVLAAALVAGASTVAHAQISPPQGDASALFAEIQRYASRNGSNYEQPIVVEYGDEFTRELAGLLGNYTAVSYPRNIGAGANYTPPVGSIVIIRPEHVGNLDLSLGDYAEPLTFSSVVAFFPRIVPTAPVGPTVRTEGTELVIGGSGSAPGQLSGPAGMAIDSAGNLSVADTNNNRVEKYDAQGNFVVAVGGYKSDVTMNQPWSTTVAADGTVFVADSWNHKVVKLDRDLKKVKEWGSGGQTEAGGDPFKLFGPRVIALSPEGHVMIVDSGNNRVIEYDGDGKFVRQFGSKGTSGNPLQFNEPSSLAVAANGDIFVADFWNKRIVHLDKDLKSKGEIKVDSWGSQAVTDRGYIALLADGRLLATDPTRGKVLVFGADGAPIATYDMPKEGSQVLARPIGIATDGTSVVVTDSIGDVARKIPLSEILPGTRDASPPAGASSSSPSTGASGSRSPVALGLIMVGVGLFAVAAAVVFIGLRRSRGGEL